MAKSRHKHRRASSGPLAKSNGIIESSEKTSILYWLTIGFVVVFLFVAPFYTGLFNGNEVSFERGLYSALLWSSMILLLTAVYFFYQWKMNALQDWLSVLIWLIPLSYLLALSSAASPHLAKNGLYLHIMYATFFILGLYLAKNRLGSALIQSAVILSGYAVVIYGFMNLFGNAYYRDAVMLDQGMRLTSVFQYANAYGAYLIMLLLGGAFLLTRSKRWYTTAFHAFMLVPILLSLLLTLSRGSLVVLPVVIVLLLPFFAFYRQILFLAYMLVGAAAALVVSGPVTGTALPIARKIIPVAKEGQDPPLLRITDPESLRGWGMLLAASLAAAAVLTLLQRWVAPWLERKLQGKKLGVFTPFVLPAAAVAGGTAGLALLFGNTGFLQLLPELLRRRLENINFQQHSVLERFTFYKDAMKLAADYPLFGAGGGGWYALYEKYQNNPYTSRQVHSFFLQYLVEAGWVGLILFIGLIGFILYRYIRHHIRALPEQRENRLIFLIAVAALLVHSCIDFEMSYAYLSVLVFLCLGGLAAAFGDKPVAPGELRVPSRWRLVYPSLLSVLAVILFFVHLNNLTANTLYHLSINYAVKKKPFAEVIQPLNDAIKRRPDHPEYLATKINFLHQAYQQTNNRPLLEEAINLSAKAQQMEPNLRIILETGFNLQMSTANYSEALASIDAGLNRYPWDIVWYERGITLRFNLWNEARISERAEEADRHAAEILRLYDEVKERTELLKQLPEGQLPGRDFRLTSAMISAVGQLYFIQGNYEQAALVLQEGLQDKLEHPLDRIIARWYLAALKIMGKNDDKLWDRLIQADPGEEEEIRRILENAAQHAAPSPVFP
jgi:O-antigen ligase